MTQLQMFDPRHMPVRTAEMLGDLGLCRAIDSMRPRRRIGAKWPYVERLIEIEGRPAWAVEDNGKRYVVLGNLVWRPKELVLANAELRAAATEAFARLDEIDNKETT